MNNDLGVPKPLRPDDDDDHEEICPSCGRVFKGSRFDYYCYPCRLKRADGEDEEP